MTTFFQLNTTQGDAWVVNRDLIEFARRDSNRKAILIRLASGIEIEASHDQWEHLSRILFGTEPYNNNSSRY